MKIDDDLDFVFLCPADGLDEVVVLPLDIWFAGSDIVGPISYRDAHVIESRPHSTRHVPNILGISMR